MIIMKKLLYLLAVAVIPFGATAQKWEGLADTPQMGWNSWNKFGQNISEKLIREQADDKVRTEGEKGQQRQHGYGAEEDYPLDDGDHPFGMPFADDVTYQRGRGGGKSRREHERHF